ncbi:MAG: sulfatase [Pirellulales bacterium]|nr:sulfatase [Pirellulales bacterium]
MQRLVATLRTMATVSAAALLPGNAGAWAAEAAKPNVLFIAVDDLNDWTTFLGGYPGVKAPNLDRLARRGTFFTRAYCSAPACNPSRASLLCGIRPSTSGVYFNSNPWRVQMPDAVTLPQHFMAHGYKVHGAGKIFHGGFKDPQSWQVYFDRPGDPVPRARPTNGIPDTTHFDWGPVDVDDDAMGDTRVTDFGVKFLAEEHEKPFFLAVGLFRPHLPWYVPRKYFDQYPVADVVLPDVKEDDLDDVPPLGVKMARPDGDHAKVLRHKQWEKAVQGYLASITYADGQIGRLLRALDDGPHANRTIIVLWADHGWHLGEKLHWRKFTLWEEAGRVPLIFVVPGLTRAETKCERTVSLLDIYPTLADLCRLPVGEHLEGKSLKPLLEDPAAEWDRPVVTTHGRNNHGVRSERWRYIRYRDGSEEFYDHQNDPMEWINLAGDPKAESGKKKLAAWLPKVNAAEGPRKSQTPRPATRRAKQKEVDESRTTGTVR